MTTDLHALDHSLDVGTGLLRTATSRDRSPLNIWATGRR